MKRLSSLLIIFAGCLLSAVLFAFDVPIYPGATVDDAATQESLKAAKAAGMTDVQCMIYTSSDPFQKVAAFYKEKAAEYTMPRASGTSGNPKRYENYDLYEAYFILDGAKDLAGSKAWVKVQRPYIGDKVQDVTAIVVTEKK